MVLLLHEFNLLSLLGIWGGLTATHDRAAGPSKMPKKQFFFFFGHLITNLTPSARRGRQQETIRLNLGKIGKTSIHKKKCF